MAYGNEKFDKMWNITSVQIAQPAAGADWVATVPAGQVWRVRASSALFTANSTVANRAPKLVVKDANGNRLWSYAVTANIAASTSGYVGFAPVAAQTSTDQLTITLPDMVLTPGCTLGPVTASIQAGDQWSGISLLVEEADAF